jgi:hypothetical protein
MHGSRGVTEMLDKEESVGRAGGMGQEKARSRFEMVGFGSVNRTNR